jgi:hypothetical protein
MNDTGILALTQVILAAVLAVFFWYRTHIQNTMIVSLKTTIENQKNILEEQRAFMKEINEIKPGNSERVVSI